MRARNANRFRPALEALGDRVVPATNYFNGGDPFDGANWSLGRYPSYHDDVIFDGTHTTDDCSLSAIGPFTSVQLVNGYTGTVTHTTDLWLGTLVIEGGVLSPSDADQDVSVTAEFEWTGGTLNGTSHLNTLTITGATTTALLAPASGGTVQVGSTIIIAGGATATMKEGDFEFTITEASININSGVLVADPGADKEVVIEANGFGGQINLDNAQTFDIKSGRLNSTGAVKNTGGTFILRSGVLAAFTGEVDKQAGAPSFTQTAGTTKLYLDTVLTLSNAIDAMLMSGGMLSIQLDVGTGRAEIVGNVKVTGGDIISGANTSGDDNHLFGELRVHGNVNWTGGTYRPFVSAAFESDFDLWYATGTFTIGGTAAIAPGAVDGENNPVLPPEGMAWVVLRSDMGITSAAGTPALLPEWAVEKDPNNMFWKVKKA